MDPGANDALFRSSTRSSFGSRSLRTTADRTMSTPTRPTSSSSSFSRTLPKTDALLTKSVIESKAELKAEPKKSRLPSYIGFPLNLILSLGLSAALYSGVPELTGYELAAVSRTLDEPWQIASLLAWRVAEIGIAWSAGLDYLDLLSLAFLSNAPYYVLLHSFYETSSSALGLGFAIDLFSLALPFYLLRPVNFYNARKRTSRPQSVSEIASDRSINTYMTLLAAAVYSLVVYSSFYTWLPIYMINHFDDVRSLEAAHNANLFVLLIACLPIGYASKNFLFKPSLASSRPLAQPFDPRTATLGETLRYNLGIGPHASRGSILISRSVTLIGLSAVNAFVRVYGTVQGTDPYGAAGWAGLWSSAATAVAIAFAWVGES